MRAVWGRGCLHGTCVDGIILKMCLRPAPDSHWRQMLTSLLGGLTQQVALQTLQIIGAWRRPLLREQVSAAPPHKSLLLLLSAQLPDTYKDPGPKYSGSQQEISGLKVAGSLRSFSKVLLALYF